MSDKITLKYTYTTSVVVDRKSYEDHAAEDGQNVNDITDAGILEIESNDDNARTVLDFEMNAGNGEIKVEIVQ